MNYNKMFDLLFSESITEDVKASVIEKVRGSINEGVEEISPCTAFLSTLVYESNISEESLNDIIDIIVGGMSEEEIEKIAEEFERAAVTVVLEWGPAPVGLTGVRKAAEQKQPPQPTAKDRLKSAVGKVKAWAGNVASKVKSAVNQPTGFDKMKQARAERIQKAVEMGTGPKAEKTQEALKPAPVKEEPKEEVKEEPKKEEPVSKKVARKTTSKTKSAAKKAASKAKSAGKKVAKIIKDAETPKEKVTAKRGRKKANEALEDAITLIAATNISGSSLVEIVEMISNKKVAEKAVEKEYQEFTKAANALNKAEEMSAKTGVPVDPEVKEKLAKQAEEKGERYEHVKALADKKFGD